MDRKEELARRTIALLEKTKKCMYKYPTQRKLLDKFLVEAGDLDAWEEYIRKVEKEVENEK